jgi:hypothetical protein
MPDNSEYCLGSLVDHASALFDVEDSDQEMEEEPLTFLCNRLKVDPLLEKREDVERQLRAKINERFVLERGIALEGLKDGIGLSGKWLYRFQ